MTLSHGLSADDRAEPAFDDHRFAPPRRRRFGGRRSRKLIAIWAVSSIGWAGAVVVEVCHQARVQADLTGDIDHDLDPVACVGPSCTDDSASDADRNWPMIVVTYLQWDMAGIAEWAGGPPLAILILGVGMILILRRRAISRRTL